MNVSITYHATACIAYPFGWVHKPIPLPVCITYLISTPKLESKFELNLKLIGARVKIFSWSGWVIGPRAPSPTLPVALALPKRTAVALTLPTIAAMTIPPS